MAGAGEPVFSVMPVLPGASYWGGRSPGREGEKEPGKTAGARDWARESVLIARHAPGLGNPRRLTYGQGILALIRIEEILIEEVPAATGDGAIESNLELMKRRGPRQRMVEDARRRG